MQSYLGDSVYAKSVGGDITLYTDNGYGPTNRIILEPQTVTALINFLKVVEDLKAEDQANPMLPISGVGPDGC